MKTSLDNAKKMIKSSNGGYNYYNKILIETTPDAKKNREFMIEFFGLNRKLINTMEDSNRNIDDLMRWLRNRNELELDKNYKVRFVFNNLIPVNNKEEALEKWGCEQDIDVCTVEAILSSVCITFYNTPRSLYDGILYNKQYLFDSTVKSYFRLVNYCEDNITLKDKAESSKEFAERVKNISALDYNKNDFLDSYPYFICKEYFSKKPIGKKFCETLSKKYPEYKITYLMDNAITEELEYITYKNGETIKEIKPQGKEGDEYNGPNSPYLKAVSIIDDPCYVICPKCGKIIDNYQVKNLECPYCDEDLSKYDQPVEKIKMLNHVYDEEV